MKTIQAHINNKVFESSTIRLQNLLALKVPDFMLDNERDIIVATEQEKIPVGGDYDLVRNWNIVSETIKTDKLGKKYYIFICEEGTVNYFPQATYGRYIKIAE